MRTQYKKQDGAYLTVYLSLVFGVCLSLLLVLIEGAAAGAARAQSELVADLGMDSVFAEYNREILDQYELFFIDSSYGGRQGGTGKVESHLKGYIDKNIKPEKDLNIIDAYTFLKLDDPYLQIEGVSYASDDNGAVWKSQAVEYMKSVYGGDMISIVKDHVDTVKGNELTTRDAVEEIAAQKQEFDDFLSGAEISETAGTESAGSIESTGAAGSTGSEESVSYDTVSGVYDSIVGNGVLSLVLPEAGSISGKTVDSENCFSSRMQRSLINKGTGIHKGAYVPDGMDDELIYNEYLMKFYGNYTNIKPNGLLDYQIEYILYGGDSDVSNLRTCAERLFALRAVSNMIYIMQDKGKKAEVEALATVICTLLAVPEVAQMLTYVILGIWALAETVVDVRSLFDGGKVPLLKDSEDWHLGLTDMLDLDLFDSDDASKGLSYEDYLRIFLALTDKDQKTVRSLDITEMDIRQTDGNADFRIDMCIDYMKVSFGFENADGYEFVFDKEMCYE